LVSYYLSNLINSSKLGKLTFRLKNISSTSKSLHF